MGPPAAAPATLAPAVAFDAVMVTGEPATEAATCVGAVDEIASVTPAALTRFGLVSVVATVIFVAVSVSVANVRSASSARRPAAPANVTRVAVSVESFSPSAQISGVLAALSNVSAPENVSGSTVTGDVTPPAESMHGVPEHLTPACAGQATPSARTADSSSFFISRLTSGSPSR